MKRFLKLIFLLSLSFFLYPRENYELLRHQMVEYQIKGRGIKDEKVLNAMLKVPRHLFVPSEIMHLAYEDYPLPIGEEQTISQPYIVALMTSALKLKGDEKVLEIGTGSGYQAAVLAEIAREVYTIEIRESLAETAEKRLKKLGYKNIKIKVGDGYYGWKEYAPFDGIIVTCSASTPPPPLLEQLREGGRMVIPIEDNPFYQTLVLITKEKGKIKKKSIETVRFVPMVRKKEK
ncbi:MAG: protein-L-isoaspartate(D-aspartate) O-methyltransferase [Candidatus Aminicenantia bacterium]